MILDDDTHILDKTYLTLAVKSVKDTILSRFANVSLRATYSSEFAYYLDYIDPLLKQKYIEERSVVDKYFNEEYKKLKNLLTDQFTIKKYVTEIVNYNRIGKKYHFIIEHTNEFFDFYIECTGPRRSGSCHYDMYKFYMTE